MIGLADLLAGTPLSERGQQYVDLIRHSASLLADVIEDILDFSSIETGHLQIDPSPIDLHQVIGNAFKCVAARAIDKPLRLIFSIEPHTPRYVLGDAKRIRQIVINLCGNAIKFTPKGEVHLRLSAAHNAASTDPQRIQINVIDSGIGIPPDKQKAVFKAFEQGEQGTTKRFGGTGLGLSISQGLAAQMEGKISLTSEVGAGSQFCAEIRLDNDPNRSVIHNASNEAGDNLAALVNLGNASLNRSTIEVLQSMNIQCVNDATHANIVLQSTRASAPELGTTGSKQRIIWISRLGSPLIQTNPGDVVLMEPVTPEEISHAIFTPENLESTASNAAIRQSDLVHTNPANSDERPNSVSDSSRGPPLTSRRQ